MDLPLPGPRADGGASPIRCLVVDDEPLVRRAVARMVESLGLTCR
jgi:CheY-like chemotaxis protein